MSKKAKNISVSVRQRLLNIARTTGRPFSELLQYYAMERFLYRLSHSPYVDKFVLKGALMLTVWNAPANRPTMDIDLLGRLDNSIDTIVGITKAICTQNVEPDGVVFDVHNVRGERITEDADYEGVRVKFNGLLDTAQIRMQLDIGFGDEIIPRAQTIDYPTILDLPAPQILGYSMESSIAEKFEAMIKLGILNSRMKDFYDIWLLSRQFDFDGSALQNAFSKTFKKRGTNVPSAPTVFSPEFSAEPTKHTQWRAFVRKNRLANTPEDFRHIVNDIAAFLGPIASHLADNKTFLSLWKAPGPWE